MNEKYNMRERHIPSDLRPMGRQANAEIKLKIPIVEAHSHMGAPNCSMRRIKKPSLKRADIKIVAMITRLQYRLLRDLKSSILSLRTRFLGEFSSFSTRFSFMHIKRTISEAKQGINPIHKRRRKSSVKIMRPPIINEPRAHPKVFNDIIKSSKRRIGPFFAICTHKILTGVVKLILTYRAVCLNDYRGQ